MFTNKTKVDERNNKLSLQIINYNKFTNNFYVAHQTIVN